MNVNYFVEIVTLSKYNKKREGNGEKIPVFKHAFSF
jgi:hypothetical protein